ncbi:hypothetical protein V6N13_118520 [Hibiscus sabdariffa]|uniref:Uncharacterized protein n=2 Tax=Hibiscus sabdariffa TaxID=183260 RepID=A0ABR2NW60_9ROSI
MSPFDRNGGSDAREDASIPIPCINDQALEKIHLEKCPSFEGVNIVGGSLQSVGESFATNSNGIGSRNVTDLVLLDVPISLEANIEVLGEGTGFGVHEDSGLSGCNPQVQSISHESRLQEVQVDVLEDKALEDISQPVLAEVYGTNKLFGLRAGLDRTLWWASTSKSNKLVKRSSSGKRISKSKSKELGQKAMGDERGGIVPAVALSPRGQINARLEEAKATLELGNSLGWHLRRLKQWYWNAFRS